MSLKCRILKGIDEANAYLERVSGKLVRKRKKKCENEVKNDFSELIKSLYCNKKDCQ